VPGREDTELIERHHHRTGDAGAVPGAARIGHYAMVVS
jgi:hypothetical protein